MTTMLDIDEFLPEALRYAPNTSDLVAQRALIDAARDICVVTKLWRENDTISIVTPALQGITTHTYASIESIEAARMGDVALTPVTVAWLDDAFPGWSTEEDATATPCFVTQTEPGTITVYPRAPGEISCRLVLKPSRRATELPAFLLEDYRQEMSRGAGAYLLTEPSSENPQVGLDLRAWFNERLDHLKIKALKGQQGARIRTKGAYL